MHKSALQLALAAYRDTEHFRTFGLGTCPNSGKSEHVHPVLHRSGVQASTVWLLLVVSNNPGGLKLTGLEKEWRVGG